MGSDCCGGDPAQRATDAAQHAHAQLARLHVTDAQTENGTAEPVAAASGADAVKAGGKADAEIVKAKLPYFKKRIELFEEYRERELQKIEAARAANVPLKGAVCSCHSACLIGHAHLPQRRCAALSRAVRFLSIRSLRARKNTDRTRL